MTPPDKAQVNRENAQHSTGPKTAEGKARSSQNARRHGLCGKSIYVPEERTDEWESLTKSLWQEIQPVGELQLQFFEQLAHAAWNTTIARELLTLGLMNMDDKRIAMANRYLAQCERSFEKALKQLKALQTDLALRAVSENEPIAHLPLTCEINKITNEANKIARLPRPKGEMTERTQPHVLRWTALSKIGRAFRPTPPEPAAGEPQNEPQAASFPPRPRNSPHPAHPPCARPSAAPYRSTPKRSSGQYTNTALP